LVDDFDRDDPVQHGVPGTVDRTLATRGYPIEDFVPAYTLERGCYFNLQVWSWLMGP